MIGACKGCNRAVEFRAFLDQVEAAVPAELDIHLVLDNTATHEARIIHVWFLKRKRLAEPLLPLLHEACDRSLRAYGTGRRDERILEGSGRRRESDHLGCRCFAVTPPAVPMAAIPPIAEFRP